MQRAASKRKRAQAELSRHRDGHKDGGEERRTLTSSSAWLRVSRSTTSRPPGARRRTVWGKGGRGGKSRRSRRRLHKLRQKTQATQPRRFFHNSDRRQVTGAAWGKCAVSVPHPRGMHRRQAVVRPLLALLLAAVAARCCTSNYVQVQSGTCEGAGHTTVVGPDRCVIAAHGFPGSPFSGAPAVGNPGISCYGPSDCGIGVEDGADCGTCNGDSSVFPRGCSAKGTELYSNTRSSGGSACGSGGYACLCRAAAACPADSTGTDDVPTGCTCDAGFSGTIAATSSSPFFSGSCVALQCTGCHTSSPSPSGPCIQSNNVCWGLNAQGACPSDTTLCHLRTCADNNADGNANDPLDCASHANAIDATPEGITCATDPCEATECCTSVPADPCGSSGGITSTDMAVTWDSHAGKYGADEICVWTLSCTDSTLVPTVTFSEFDTKDDDDFVYAFDGAQAPHQRDVAALSRLPTSDLFCATGTCDHAGFSPADHDTVAHCGSGGPSLMSTASGAAVPAGAQRGTGSSVRTQQQRNQRDGM